MSVCKECAGLKTIERSGKLYNCECFYIEQASRRMPAHIRKARILPAHLGLPILRAVSKSVYFRGAYEDVKCVIKAVMLKYDSKWVKLTSDAEIRNVYVGSMSKSARSDDYVGEIYNSIQDLMDPPELVIVQLGVISNKNKAAPGALEEALQHRIQYEKPIWVFSTLEQPFGTGSYAYSPRVSEILDSMLSATIPKITSVQPGNEPETPTFAVEPVAQEKPQERKERQVDKDDPLSQYGSGLSKKKSSFRGRS